MSNLVDVRPVPVFEARSGRRRIVVSLLLSMFLALCLGVGLSLAWRVYSLPSLGRPPVGTELMIPGGPAALARSRQPSMWAFAVGPDQPSCQPENIWKSGPKAGVRPIVAYVEANDSGGLAAVARHCDQIDLVLAQNYELADATGSIRLLREQALTATGVTTVPVVQIGADLSATEVEDLLEDESALESLSARLNLLEEGEHPGLCLDLSDRTELSVRSVSTALGHLDQGGLRCVIGSADAELWEDRAFVESLDLAVIAGFRTPSGPAEPAASTEWFVGTLARAQSLIPTDKLVVALGTTGHAWRSGQPGLRRISYVEGMTEAADHAATAIFVPRAGATRLRYVDDFGALTEAWLPDAAGIQNQLTRLGPGVGVAVWPVGSEDPAVWGLLDANQAAASVLAAPIRLDHAVELVGTGSFVSASSPSSIGQREVEMDVEGRDVVAASYATLPRAGRLIRSGEGDDSRISLSFDGLPAEDRWPDLARVLADAGVEATFVVRAGDLLTRGDVAAALIASGHVLGLQDNPVAERMPAVEQVTDNLRQLLAANRTGLRPRFVEVGAEKAWDSLAARSSRLIEEGYIPIIPAATLTPEDLGDPAKIAERISDGGKNLSGRVAIETGPFGWDQVIAALPRLLADLSEQGYEFTSLRSEANLELMQAMPPALETLSPASSAAFAIAAVVSGGLSTLLLWFLLVSAVRSAGYLVLALIRRPRNEFDPAWQPPATVIVPAFNEDKVIRSCLNSILASDYPNLVVVVVDDGSTDLTSQVVASAFAQDPRVKLVRQRNRGKWAATNAGLAITETPIFMIADADSVFLPDTIGWLVQQFKDPRVGAVAGLVEVGNRTGLLESCQLLEYIVSQSVLRRAQEVFDGILVVPGAVGAWRMEAVRKAGLFTGDTVTEDADLTIAVHRAGYTVRFQEQARSITEVPTTVRSFMRQRLRWTFGMFQASWKHRAAITEGRAVGYLSIVDAIWFSLLSGLLAPIVDLLLLGLIVQGLWALASDGVAAVWSLPVGLLIAYFALTVIDVLNTLVAFRFEKRLDWKLLALVPVVRFGYRQLLYISTIRALVRALTGTATGWNKLDRTGAILSLWSRLRAPVDQPISVKSLPAGE